MTTGPSNLEPEYIIGFGEPDWQAHLGGGFLGPESGDGVSYNWISAERAWCVLPELRAGCDYLVRLEAAPLAPYESDVQMIRVSAGENEACWVTSRGAMFAARDVELKLTPDVISRTPAGPELKLTVSCEFLAPPRLAITINDIPAARLDYETRTCMQIRDFPVPRDLLGSSPVMFFEPNLVFQQQDFEGSPDARSLSIRLFRMMLYPLG
jgi:hypothetical protein